MNEAEKRVKILEVFHETVSVGPFLVDSLGFYCLSRSRVPILLAVSTLTNEQKDFFTVRSGSIQTNQPTQWTSLYVDS